MPTVLITGATGFIGRALCSAMLEQGWVVKGCVQKNAGQSALPKNVSVVFLDLKNDPPLNPDDLSCVDAVIHLAARVHKLSERSQNPLQDFRQINVVGTQRIARLAAKAGVKKFIFVSSVKVHGESSQRPYRETDAPSPQDAYGVSKKEAEEALKNLALETGLQTVILRLPLVYGQGVKANFKNLIALASLGWPLPFKNVCNQRSFLYLGNLIDAILLCLSEPKAIGETFLVSDGQDISTPKLLYLIAAAMNKRVILFALPLKLLTVLGFLLGQKNALEKLTCSLCIDNSKIKNLLGWQPPYSLDEGIAQTVKKIDPI